MSQQDRAYTYRAAFEYADQNHSDMKANDLIYQNNVSPARFAAWYVTECEDQGEGYWPSLNLATWERFAEAGSMSGYRGGQQ